MVQVQRVLDGARHRGLPLAPLLHPRPASPSRCSTPRWPRVSQAQYAQLLRVLAGASCATSCGA